MSEIVPALSAEGVHRRTVDLAPETRQQYSSSKC